MRIAAAKTAQMQKRESNGGTKGSSIGKKSQQADDADAKIVNSHINSTVNSKDPGRPILPPMVFQDLSRNNEREKEILGTVSGKDRRRKLEEGVLELLSNAAPSSTLTIRKKKKQVEEEHEGEYSDDVSPALSDGQQGKEGSQSGSHVVVHGVSIGPRVAPREVTYAVLCFVC